MNTKKENEQKLNIGYLLPDWRDANAAFFRFQLLTHYNKKKFHVFCYAPSGAREFFEEMEVDMVTWRDLDARNEELAAQVIREDKITILVDLFGYKSSKCLGILARRPARLQAGFVGYAHAPSLSALDYLLTDKYCDPLSERDCAIEEKLFRLPQSHFCYTAPKHAAESKGNPFKQNHYVTFGSFHHFTKLTDEFLLIWAKILQQVPDSKLILKNRVFGSGYGCQEIRYRLRRLGFPIERVELRPAKQDNTLSDYQEIDIILDTYPHQGGAYSYDALYMGVPVVVMTGKARSLRFGYSMLKNIGLEECIAFNADDYIKRAAALANHPYKLTHLRKNLRARMLKSPIMDVRRYTANVERAYLDMWHRSAEAGRVAAYKSEIVTVVRAVREGMDYIAGSLQREGDSELVHQILTDAIHAFNNMRRALWLTEEFMRFRALYEAIRKQFNTLLKQYKRQEYDRVCEKINQTIIPDLSSLQQCF